MNKFTRLTALLLALMMIFSTFAAAEGYAVDGMTQDAWSQIVQNAQEQLFTTDEGDSGQTVIPPDPESPGYDGDYYPYTEYFVAALAQYDSSSDMTPSVDPLEISSDGLAVLQNDQAGQWQINIGGMWVNIAGETDEELWVNAAMMNTLTVAEFRKVFGAKDAETGAYTTFTQTATVEIVPAQAAVLSLVTREGEGDTAPEGTTGGSDNVMTLEDANDDQTVNVIIDYKFSADNMAAADSYRATVAINSDFKYSIPNPNVVGYKASAEITLPADSGITYIAPTVDEATGEVQQPGSVNFDIASMQSNITLTVTYVPTKVQYKVVHKLQNVSNDEYTIKETTTTYGYTGDTVPEKDLAKTYEGFYALPYERPEIAASGNTEVEVRYDRYYYLINFELGGGYGVEPIYARYGTTITEDDVGTPTLAGWTFAGWSTTENGPVNVTFPLTMGAKTVTYYAVYKDPQATTYTVVYYRENADDEEYAFWGAVTHEATAGDIKSAADDVPTSISNATIDGYTVNEKPYFAFNADLSNTGVVIKGDGSSVVNVYYDRNTYTVYFTGYGTCCLEEHTHGAACTQFDCGYTVHTHDEYCEATLTCTIPLHTHDEDCCTRDTTHTHTRSCYNNVDENPQNNTNGYPQNVADGYVYQPQNSTRKYIYIAGQWYRYRGNTSSGQTAQPGNNCPGAHTHGDGNCTCTRTEHAHGDACYSYSCGLVNHTHTNACCAQLVHTHSNNCDSNNTSNTIYVLTAKYNANIADLWPTYDVLATAKSHAYKNSSGQVVNSSGTLFRGWNIDGVSSTSTSKRVNMTANLCDTGDGVKYADAVYGYNYYVHLYYMFESFDQTSPANGNTRKLYNGKYYDSDPDYYQDVYGSSSEFGQKQIMGMDAVDVESERLSSSEYNNFLYYTRNKHTLTFVNVTETEKTVSNVMYGQPLQNYTDANGNLLRDFTLDPAVDLPEGYEEGAYVFGGWYTTAECYPGTKFEFDEYDTMPDNDLTLYAYWAPVEHTVTYYLTEADKAAGNVYHPDGADTEAQFTVAHGDFIDQEYVRAYLDYQAMANARDPYTFVAWFYEDASGKHPFSPATKIVRDMELVADWISIIPVSYTVKYLIEGTTTPVASETTGTVLAGLSRTFEAKGDTELFAEYQVGYFPKVVSQNYQFSDAEAESGVVIIFYYTQAEKVPYTVKYINAETGTNEFTDANGNTFTVEPKIVTDNAKAVVTETFQVISGYMPDAYQKRLVVAPGADNEIVFTYTRDEVNAYYQITHYTQNLDGSWSEYDSWATKGVIGTSDYVVSSLTIDGFTYVPEKDEYKVGDLAVDSTHLLTNAGLEINLYYTRNSYPYEIRYLEQNSYKELLAPVTGTALLGDTVPADAEEITNYTLVSTTPQQLEIRIETTLDESGKPVASRNVITFFYKEQESAITYIAVGPDNQPLTEAEKLVIGSVDRESESIPKSTGDAKGSTATLLGAPTYKFVGWYSDPACKNLVSTEETFVPEKPSDSEVWISATYYAKFEYNVSTLTITKEGMVNGESAIVVVTVNGVDYTLVFNRDNTTATIANVLIGSEYSVQENTDWSWRYSNQPTIEYTDAPEGTVYKIDANAELNKVTITNTRGTDKWLSDESAVENNLGNGNQDELNNQ